MSWARGPSGLGTKGTGTSGGSYGKLAPLRPEGRWNGAAALPKSLLQRAFARNSALHRLDGVLLAAVLALSLIGTLLVWSATASRAATRTRTCSSSSSTSSSGSC
jgi:hypothetical protein